MIFCKTIIRLLPPPVEILKCNAQCLLLSFLDKVTVFLLFKMCVQQKNLNLARTDGVSLFQQQSFKGDFFKLYLIHLSLTWNSHRIE